jgi:protein-tyrosine phosphatase
MADGWLREKAEAYQLDLLVDSAGTASFHVGDKPDARMRKHALNYGVDISNLRARLFVAEDFDRFDVIFAMDKSNRENILKLAKTDEQRAKVKLYLNELFPHEDREVPDPYYGSAADFTHVIELLEQTTEAFIQHTFRTKN